MNTQQGTLSQRVPKIALAAALLVALLTTILTTPVRASSADTKPRTLVLYDSTGPWGFLGEIYGQQTANLAGHFGSVTVHKATTYRSGELDSYTALIYVGSTYDEPLPGALIADVGATTKPVLWAGSNIWQLTAANPNFIYERGWMWSYYDTSEVTTVTYKGRNYTRSSANKGGIIDYYSIDPAKVTVLATANRSDGTTFPWAVRSGNLTYVGEEPYSYISETDRYLIWADLLFDLLAPETPERHRAMVRIEDVGPDADPNELRQIADYLHSKNIPFTVATYSQYRDPLGTYNGGKAVAVNLRANSAVTSALRYMVSKGGTIIQHGRTHQFEKMVNPYSGTSADDFEFYTAHVDANDLVVLDGPVPKDSKVKALARISAGRADFAIAGLPLARVFEFPHYAASVKDYQAVQQLGLSAYERRLYFPGFLSNTTIDYTRPTGQFFPYVVTDVYGTRVLPENIGNYEPLPYNQHPATLPADLVERARLNLGVRDGFASFFYHPYNGVEPLREIVEGIDSLGAYDWVAATSL